MSIRNFFSSAGGELSPAVIIRRVMFLILLLALGFFYLAIDFRGLTHPKGIDQAQIAREIARGNGFTTQMVRPLSLDQMRNHAMQSEDNEDSVSLTKFHDTYHAPLNPMLNSVVLGMFEDKWSWTGEGVIYFPDRVIAVVSIILFLWAIGINYLLISRIFDTKIGGVTALLLLLCDMLWEFSQSGLPQMLMFFLFSFAMYFLYKAIENYQLKRSPLLWLCLCGGFFGLLAMAHWIAIWPFLGLLIFTSFYFKPRGVQAVSMAGVFLIFLLIWGVRNNNVCGQPLGSGYFSILGGLTNSESAIMRNFDQDQNPLNAKGMPTRLVLTSLAQLNSLYVYLGSIIAAPLFFFSLLHPFKRPEISSFRWCILLMWLFAVFGMSIFGLADGVNDPNQLHLLFIPIMTAYGLAFLSVLWSRLGITSHLWMILNGHLIMVVFISALPLLLTFFPNIKRGLYAKDFKTPAYTMRLLQKEENFKKGDVIVTDSPWSVAWYGDRTAVWLPGSLSQFKELEAFARERKSPVKGLLFTSESIDKPMISGVIGIGAEYRDWYQPIVFTALLYANDDLAKKIGTQLLADFDLPYKYLSPRVAGGGIVFFTDEVPERAN
jgi:hypothetical protein